jgi:hypothetical protein
MRSRPARTDVNKPLGTPGLAPQLGWRTRLRAISDALDGAAADVEIRLRTGVPAVELAHGAMRCLSLTAEQLRLLSSD